MICSPWARRRAAASSCLPPDVLEEMRSTYNRTARSTSVIAPSDPETVRAELDRRLEQKCSNRTSGGRRELCWIDHLPGMTAAQKKRLRDRLFVPPTPREWAKKPDAWLSNFDIAAVMSQYEAAHPEFLFVDPVPIDFAATDAKSDQCFGPELCTLTLARACAGKKTAVGAVLNLDTHRGPGTHWVALFLRLDCGAGQSPNQSPFLFYFNSTGEEEPKEILALRDRLQAEHAARFKGRPLPYFRSTTEHQRGNNQCGVYAIMFLIAMLERRHPFTHAPMTDAELIQLFTGESAMVSAKGGSVWSKRTEKQRIPDESVARLRRVLFRPTDARSNG